ncbi:DUF3558 domain-containing protein [Saccharomonospora xinjiangensis]|uniref:DUF3558 domain-containing protein n=2 Tax=Saccharomonospora TaxID=1851 RepID=I0UWX5_9PSEU|nr:DUF3558 domain-containing protein [Saccharomonospora xinjiangensis]EID52378.1 Protein of unknown function (DUF3558) [Saccharomonospora xinjiangensis XJ-54]QBQ60323.1 hypothetical protein EYD13_09835 [Saccharomonospora xinjiangensis]
MCDYRFRFFRIFSMVAVVLFGASCSAGTEGVAQPAVDDTTTSVAGKAPERKVSEPLDISPYLSRPCELVSPEMLAKLGTSPSEATPRLPEDHKVSAEFGPSCDWSGEDEGGIGVNINSGNKERGLGGLRGHEMARDQGRYELWEETSISSYPAVYLGVSDARDRGDCELVVGIADDMTFGVSAVSFYENPEKACRVADEVAADVIETLKSGS